MHRSRSLSRRAARAFVAVLLLFGFQASSLEAVLGLARDGAVHHESLTAAVAHNAERGAEHGHEAASEAPDQQHGPEHQHGTGADHCTHAHGMALLALAPVPDVEGTEALPGPVRAWTPTDFRAAPLFHPPRA